MVMRFSPYQSASLIISPEQLCGILESVLKFKSTSAKVSVKEEKMLAAVTFWALWRPCHFQNAVSEIYSTMPPSTFLPIPAPSSLELGDLQGWSTAEVQKEGSFLFRQESGGGDVIDACWDMIYLHVAETTSARSKEEAVTFIYGRGWCHFRGVGNETSHFHFKR